jgi:sucrose-6-phosphate hydrolase SacC (GH32 family)
MPRATGNGLTYTNYSGHAVLNSPTGDNPNFRDPKVFFYAPTNSWIMTVALPRAHQVLIYRSTDLIHWGSLPVSTFGPVRLGLMVFSGNVQICSRFQFKGQTRQSGS